MNNLKIPVAFYTAVHGYSWYCTNKDLLGVDLNLFEAYLFAGGDEESQPIAGVFNCGQWVVFYRRLMARNFDFEMRSAKYYAIGVVARELAGKINFKWIFKQNIFVRPVPRDDALKNNFPAYLDYEGGNAYETHSGELCSPSKDFDQKSYGEDVLCYIGSWFNKYDDRIIKIYGEITQPSLDVKILPRSYEEGNTQDMQEKPAKVSDTCVRDLGRKIVVNGVDYVAMHEEMNNQNNDCRVIPQQNDYINSSHTNNSHNENLLSKMLFLLRGLLTFRFINNGNSSLLDGSRVKENPGVPGSKGIGDSSSKQ